MRLLGGGGGPLLVAWRVPCCPEPRAGEGTKAAPHQNTRPANPPPQILETKVRKLEQLVKLKDAKIHTLCAKLQSVGLL